MEVMGDENPQSIPKILDRIPRYPYPICSVYGIFTYIWVIFRANLYVNIPYMEHMDNIGSSMTQYKLDLTISIISNSYRGPSTGMRSGGITNDNQTLPSGNQTGQWKIYYSYLVGGFNPSQKYQSIGMIIPSIWENKSHVPVTTNQIHDFPIETTMNRVDFLFHPIHPTKIYCGKSLGEVLEGRITTGSCALKLQ